LAWSVLIQPKHCIVPTPFGGAAAQNAASENVNGLDGRWGKGDEQAEEFRVHFVLILILEVISIIPPTKVE
jgi:hypothetical protein